MAPRSPVPLFPAFPRLLHGGDYNPEQWLHQPEVIVADFRLMREAKCNAMSVGIFSWAMLEPEEGRFEFAWLDDIMSRLANQNMKAVLATPSGAKPAWLSLNYPEIRRMNDQGLRDPHRGRHNHCRTSPVYREKTALLNRLLAERYKAHPALLLWHVSNEYSGEPCHCPLCFEAFRQWLKQRYHDNLEELNQAWWSAFWSHRFHRWEEITAIDPSMHGMVLDWKRFITDQTLDFFRNEIKPLRELTPDTPVTINMMGTYLGLNYWKFAPHVDIVSYDSYPGWHSEPDDLRVAADTAFNHDLNRSFKGQPFLLMESTPSQVNWQPICKPKRPGMHILSSLQAVAHGADSVQYFQWRKSRGSCEKFHGAVVDHDGSAENRVFQEVARLGAMLEKLAPVAGSGTPAEIAVVFDWENVWAIDEHQGFQNREKHYGDEVRAHYRELWRRNLAADVVNADADFSRYKLVIAPMLHMVRTGVDRRLAEYVRQGGALLLSFLSGMVNENDLCWAGGFPGGELAAAAGLRVTETDVFYPGQRQTIRGVGGNPIGLRGEYDVQHYADVIQPKGAETVAAYNQEFYANSPAVTVNAFGKGACYYLGARLQDPFLTDFYTGLVKRHGLRSAVQGQIPAGVSAQLRRAGNRTFLFLMNFTTEARTITLPVGQTCRDLLEDRDISGTVKLPAYAVRVLAGTAG